MVPGSSPGRGASEILERPKGRFKITAISADRTQTALRSSGLERRSDEIVSRQFPRVPSECSSLRRQT